MPCTGAILSHVSSALQSSPVPAPGPCASWKRLLLLVAVAAVGDAPLHAAEGFTRMDPLLSGVRFTNVIPASRYLTNQIPLNGSGVALGDVDGDQRTDLLLAGLAGSGGLFLNQGGWSFSDQTAASGLRFEDADSTGVVLADLDGDGSLDALFNTIGRGTRLWSNDGRGHFTLRTTLNPRRAGMSLGVADLDADGDLDLYVVNYRGTSVRDEPGGRFSIRDDGQGPRVVQYNGRPTTEEDLVGRFTVGPQGVRENGEPDALYLNEGGWRFRQVDWTDGTFLDEGGQPLPAPLYEWGLSVAARDLTGDGRPDLYVCNDFESPDRFWINQTVPGGKLRFQAAPMTAIRRTSAFSMGVDAADLDRDGHWDFLVLDMLSRDHRLRNVQVAGLPQSYSMVGVFEDRPQFSHNTLFRGRGDGTFAEVGRLAGLSASEWSWTPLFLDVDLDGYEDLLVSNGHQLDMMDADVSDAAEAMKASKRMTPREQLELRSAFRRLNTPNAAFRNRGALLFEDVSHRWGFDVAEVGIGMAGGDLDGDGDVDLVVNNLNSPPTLYRNDADAPRVAVRLRGSGKNTRGIGARIRVTGGPVSQMQEMIAGGRYLSSDEPLRVFATGGARSVEVEVRWPDGRMTRKGGIAPGAPVELSADGATQEPAPPAAVAPLFGDATARLGFSHGENPFDDFARQPLLGRNLSQAGPGLAWVDLDGDGVDDLLVGAGAGALPGVLRGDGRGGFLRVADAPFNKPTGRDLTAVLPFGPVWLAGLSNHEDGLTNGGALRILDPARKVSGEAVLNQGIHAGPIAAADLDGDGALELFVGGRAVPGEYPRATDSLLLKSVGGRFTVVQRFAGLGLVNDAVAVDLDADGRCEIVLACEWGPVRVLAHREGAWRERTSELGLMAETGWWNSVVPGDFNNDGLLDLAVGNWGWNTWPGVDRDTSSRALHWGDLDGNGTADVVETYGGSGGAALPVRRGTSMMAAFPWLKERFPTHKAYAGADVGALFGDALRTNPVASVRVLASRLLLNTGTGFQAVNLPLEAQCSPVFGMAVADWDGDGNEDLFLAQNFFPVHPEEARQDGGVGCLLMGDGQGGFTPLSPQDSGIAVHGEGRGVAAADYDQDGRVDLAVAQNGAAVRLFHNQRARPGIRVRVDAGPGNPTGAGCQVRLWSDGKAGPVRAWHLGGGYWSTGSATIIPACRATPTHVEVRWPGGRVAREPLPAGARSIRVAPDGKVLEVNR